MDRPPSELVSAPTRGVRQPHWARFIDSECRGARIDPVARDTAKLVGCSAEVLAGITKAKGVRYAALTPNMRCDAAEESDCEFVSTLRRYDRVFLTGFQVRLGHME